MAKGKIMVERQLHLILTYSRCFSLLFSLSLLDLDMQETHTTVNYLPALHNLSFERTFV